MGTGSIMRNVKRSESGGTLYNGTLVWADTVLRYLDVCSILLV
jgi:hypothetical protein